ncbi:MAG: TetR/AcrR family transcriptional regulator [Deltaproteobacteria bacterium]|nr:TetR/AcrR family transcriptional regulator [Deltaproteobacteria bacterium]
MPKKPRSPDEMESAKSRILECSLSVLAEKGFEGLSMREVARRMGVVVGTLYGYYRNRDDLYLAVLTRGFERLYDRFRKIPANQGQPLENLAAMAGAYLDFGLEEPHFYNIMFTWHVPKFRDYLNTPMEQAARVELETALAVYRLVLDQIDGLLAETERSSTEDNRYWAIFFWSTLHGYVAGLNNTLLNYMHDKPLDLKERFLATLLESIRLGLSRLGAEKGL